MKAKRMAGDDILSPLHTLFRVGVVGDLSDGQLLRKFTSSPDGASQAIFTALVGRHGAMVMGVCRRALGNSHDAQDAFQATFLVLARRARSVRDADSLAGWLHGVALRVCMRAKADAARRRKYERLSAGMRPGPGGDEAHEGSWAGLHEEIGRLPAKYREPVVLCYLEGLTTEAAASRLGCPRGTVLSRLSRARDRLRGRLERRGMAHSSSLFTAGGVPAVPGPLPAVVLDATARSALSLAGRSVGGIASIPPKVLALARGESYAMAITKLEIFGAAALTGALTLGAASIVARQADPPAPRRGGAEPRGRATESAQAPRMVLVEHIYRDKGLVILSERFTESVADPGPRGEPRRSTKYYRYHSEKGRAALASGQGVEGEEFWSRLRVGATILLSPDEHALNPHYRRPLREDALILIGEVLPNGISD